VQSAFQVALGSRSACLAEGVQLLLERMDRHEPALQRASESAAGITSSARSALLSMAARLSLSKATTDPARFLLAVQTYYALVVKLGTYRMIEHAGQPGSPAPGLLTV